MAGPWEDYSAGGPWEDFQEAPKKRGLAGKTAKDFMPTEQETNDYLSNIQGLAEAGLNTLTGMFGGGLGTLTGTIAGIHQHGLGTDEQRKAVEAEAGRQAESLTFQPRTERGKEIAENVGKGMEQLIPIMPMLPQLEGAGMAARTARELKAAARQQRAVPPPGGFAPEVPLTLDEAIAQAEKAPENQRVGPSPKTTLPWEDYAPEVQGKENLRARGQLELPLEEQPVIAVSGRGEAVPMSAEAALERPPEVALEAQRRAEAEANRPAPLEGQGDLFMNEEVTGPIASPVNAAERGALPEVPTENPALARRQMELQLENQGTLYGGPEGLSRELPSTSRVVEDAAQIEYARQQAEAKAREIQAKAAVENGQTGNLFADYVNQHRPYELFRDENGRPLSRSMFNETVDNLAKEKSTGYVRPEDMDAAYTKYLSNFDGVQAGLFDQPTTALEMAATLKKDAATRMVASHPIVKAAERFLNEQQQFLDQLKQQGANAEMIKDAAKDVANATARLEKTKSNVEKGITQALPKKPKKTTSPTGEVTYMYEGLGESIRRVGAWTGILGMANDKAHSSQRLKDTRVEITAGENKQKFLPQGVREELADYTKERRSAEDIKADIVNKNIPDMKATPLSDKFQAGGLYKQIETNNPIVRKTFAAVSDADHNASANIRTYIGDKNNGLPAVFRQLTKKEAGDWWAARQMVEGERALSPQEMRDMGMSEKQIKMNTKLDAALDFAFDQINKARELAGKAPIDKRMGYLAGQIAGDFRKIIYKKGTDEVVGVIGNDVRHLLDKRTSAILEQHPEWDAGPTKMSNRTKRDSRQKAFEDAVEMITDQNPDMKNLVDAYDKTLKDDAYNYMNAKKHTMQKKGVFGQEGFKRDVDAWTNAKQGMSSQIRYIEKMLRWSEMSKAVDEVRPLLKDDTINMPNAKKWSNDYIDRALGIQTNAIGHALDGVLSAVGENMGVGSSAIERGVGTVKGAVSKTLLGFFNPMFLAINLMQPATSLPALNSLLRARGLEHASMSGLPGNLMSFMKMANEGLGKLTPFEKAIKEEGLKRNLFGSEIFDHTTHLTKASYGLNRVAEIGIPAVEGATRGFVFTHFSKLLEKNGYKGRELFDIAENLTNQAMTDYRSIEAPSIYKEMGAVGEMAVTLQRYKHNQLSNLAALAREASRNGNYRPIATALATGMAFSGLTGMLGFNEADKAYQVVTKMMGKPDTLTRLALDKLPDSVNFGVLSTLSGIDMSKRFGMQLFPDSVSGTIFPGVSRLADMGSAAVDFAKSPGEVTGARLAREIAPGLPRSLIDAAEFQDKNGMAYNPRTLEATVQRTPTDVAAKYLGGQGLEESKTKAQVYQRQLVDKMMTENRQKAITRIEEELYPLRGNPTGVAEFFESDRGQELKDQFLEAEGDVKGLINAVKKFQRGLKLTAEDRQMLSASKNPQRAKRYMGEGE